MRSVPEVRVVNMASFSSERMTEAGQSNNVGSMPKRADELDNGSWAMALCQIGQMRSVPEVRLVNVS